ncbi:HIRAN domain-containing protein [Micromonospora sp. CPCC 206061]|uniref:HIRAN domain-containing protein n=1 Tax=Micromonospora sp. CPCC 206061 TaxID=3122410 RepID=UPI002FF3C0A4
MSIAFDLWGQRGWARVDVAGESHHAKAIRAVVGPDLKSGGSEIKVDVQLLPEPNNRFDRNAIAVWCGNHQLGYLPKEVAPQYVSVLSGLVANGWTPQVQARIWASVFSYDDEPGRGEFHASVTLDLAEPHMLVPTNMPPNGEHRTLPLGNAIQVTGEDRHLDALAPHLRPEGETWAYATLHEVVEETARTSKAIVEIRINDERVGQLTPKMSSEVLPAIRHLAEAGVTTAARVIVKGNRIKAEVVLYVARAHELPDEWLRETARARQPAVAVATASSAPSPAAAYEPPRQHAPIPPPPTSIRFTVPPGWPTPPQGWAPPSGWRPDPSWPLAPEGWQWWVPAWD